MSQEYNDKQEAPADSLTDVLDMVTTQYMKNVYTSMPGIIQKYDHKTKRATVLPAMNTITTKGDSVQKAAIANVQVLYPSAGKFVLTMPIKPGDPVLLVFSQRGLAAFKQTHEQADPDKDGFFSMKDAVAITGFGALEIEPATTEGTSLQHEDGKSFVYVEEENIRIETTTQVTIKAPDTRIEGRLHVTDEVTFDKSLTTTEDVKSGRDLFYKRVFNNSNTGKVTITEPMDIQNEVVVTGHSVTHDGVPIDKTHTHNVTAVGAPTGTPA